MQRLYIEMQGKSISSKVTDKGSSAAVCTSVSVVGYFVNVLFTEIFQKFSGALNLGCNHSKSHTKRGYHRVMCAKIYVASWNGKQ